MIIHRDCFVKMAYRLHLNSGRYIRGSAEQPEILTYIAGYKELLPGLENKLLGLRPGAESQFVIPAAEAFGLRDPKLVQEFNKKRFPGAELSPGMKVIPSSSAIEPEYPYTVLEVKDETIVLDQNHPMAGEDLHYAVQILEVRDATLEELEPLQKCESCGSGSCET